MADNSDLLSGYTNEYILNLTLIDDMWYIQSVITSDEYDKQLAAVDFELSALNNSIENDKIDNNREIISENCNRTSNHTVYINTNNVKFYAQLHALNYNSYFYAYSGADCQNFASQCIYYGLGGSLNNQNNCIENKDYPMIDNSSDKWYQTSSADYQTRWTHVPTFYSSINSYTTEGLNGTMRSGYAYAQVGDIIQVEYDDGDSAFDHSYVVTAVTGIYGSRTVNNIYVCAHTSNRRNNLLSVPWPNGISSANSRTIHITSETQYY
jgi:hypothetical protein